MSQKRTDMEQLEELVRLHRMGTGYREVARLLGISPNTERQYRDILTAAGLLAGAVEALPALAELQAAVAAHLGAPRPPQQTSSVEPWSEPVQAMMAKGATPKAIYDCLRFEYADFAGSLSAIKRLYAARDTGHPPNRSARTGQFRAHFGRSRSPAPAASDAGRRPPPPRYSK